jgi:hypothetical protein
MLRTALALLSSLQIGVRIKEAVERSLKQAVVIAVAVVVLVAAAAFGLVAGYQALVLSYGFTPPAAAGVIAGALALLGFLILATLPLFAGKRKPQSPAPMAAASEGLGVIDQGVGKAMQQVGPVTLLAIAFVAGVLLSRRK